MLNMIAQMIFQFSSFVYFCFRLAFLYLRQSCLEEEE